MDLAVELTTGNESQLTKLIQSGDVSRAVQLAKAAIVAVDEDNKARQVTQEQLKEKKREVMKKFATYRFLLLMILRLLPKLLIAWRTYFGMTTFFGWL